MVETLIKPGRNVIDLAAYRLRPRPSDPAPLRARFCRHCGAGLAEGESEDECSGAGLVLQHPTRAWPSRVFYVD